MKRVRIQIDRKHAVLLIAGETVAIKVPKDAEVIELRLERPANQRMGDSFAKICDVVFNGRPA